MSTKETWFCPLPARSCSRVAHSRSSCYPAFNRRTCTYRTSYERFCICHSVARWKNLSPVPMTERYRMCSWAHWSRNRIWCVWTYPEWQTRWGMVLPLSSHVYSLDTDEIIRKHDGSRYHVIFALLDDSPALSFVSILSPRTCQYLAQVLLNSGLGFGLFLDKHVHIFEDKRNLFELNDVMNVHDKLSLLKKRIMNEILVTRH